MVTYQHDNKAPDAQMQAVPAQVAPPYPRFTRGVSEVSQPVLATQEGPEGEGMKHIWLFNVFCVLFLSITTTNEVMRGHTWWLWISIPLAALNVLAAYVNYRRARS